MLDLSVMSVLFNWTVQLSEGVTFRRVFGTVTLQKKVMPDGPVIRKLICLNEWSKLNDATVELLCTVT